MVTSCSPFPLVPGKHHSIFVFMNLTSLGPSYKWDHTVIALLWLAYFTQHNVLKIHSCCSVCQNFLLFLKLNNIPLYVCTIFSLFIILWWTLGCSHVLSIVSHADVNCTILLLSGYVTTTTVKIFQHHEDGLIRSFVLMSHLYFLPPSLAPSHHWSVLPF